MATNETPSFDDFDTVEESDGSDSNRWIDPEPGSMYSGEITAFNPRRSDAGVVEINGRPYKLNHTERQQLIEALVVGREMAVRTLDEEKQFSPDDKEGTITYNPTEVGFR